MDLHLSPEDAAFREHVRAWLAENLPRDELTTLEERIAWQRKLYEAGFIGMGWPKEYGGAGARPMEQAIVAAEMAHVNAPGPVNHLGLNFIGPTLIVHGAPEQKAAHLQKILSAEEIWCQLYSEPNAGSDLASVRTSAVDAGDHWIVNGQKVWTTNGPISHWAILLARTDPNVPKHKGITCFLINMRQPGVVVRPLKQLTGGSEFSEVFMTDARVEKSDIIGEVNHGWEIAQTTLGFERGGSMLTRFAVYSGSLERLVQVCKSLQRNGQTAWDDPVTRQKIGQAFAELEVIRYIGLRILSGMEKGHNPGPESAVAKLYYSEFDKRYHELVMSILGPYGTLLEGTPAALEKGMGGDAESHPSWAHDFLWSRAPTIFAGTSEIQRNIIGDRVLGLPKEVRADRLKAKAQ
ncbi:MAG: acyl-CoA dehydrogenase family protein [Anaerolineae bacterium]